MSLSDEKGNKNAMHARILCTQTLLFCVWAV